MAKLIDAINAKQKMSDAIKSDIDQSKASAEKKKGNLETLKDFIRAAKANRKNKAAGK